MEGRAVVGGGGGDVVALGEFAGQDFAGEGVFDVALDGAAQGARAECLVVALAGEPVAGVVGEFDCDAVFSKAVGDFGDADVHDLADLGLGEWVEDDGGVYAV